MCGATISAHEEATGRQTVFGSNAQKIWIRQLLGRVEDDPRIHHDVDEHAVRCQERAQVAPTLVEAQRQRPPGLDDDALDTLIAGEIVPALPGRPEEEAEIMNAAIALARFDEPGVVLGTLTPPWITGAHGDDREHAADKALTPVRPGFLHVVRSSPGGAEREVVGIGWNHVPYLQRCDVHC